MIEALKFKIAVNGARKRLKYDIDCEPCIDIIFYSK